MLRSELSICRPPLYLMKPNFRNLFIKKFTRERVVMGRRNTGPKSNLQVFQRLNSLESADSKKTLPYLGLIEYSSKDQVSLKNTIGSTD
jgi:hypothetical protein